MVKKITCSVINITLVPEVMLMYFTKGDQKLADVLLYFFLFHHQPYMVHGTTGSFGGLSSRSASLSTHFCRLVCQLPNPSIRIQFFQLLLAWFSAEFALLADLGWHVSSLRLFDSSIRPPQLNSVQQSFSLNLIYFSTPAWLPKFPLRNPLRNPLITLSIIMMTRGKIGTKSLPLSIDHQATNLGP